MCSRSAPPLAAARRALASAAHPRSVSRRLAGRVCFASLATIETSSRVPGREGSDSVQSTAPRSELAEVCAGVSAVRSTQRRCHSATRKTGSPSRVMRGAASGIGPVTCTLVRNSADGALVVSACCSTSSPFGSSDQGNTVKGIVCNASSGTKIRRRPVSCSRSGHRTRRATRSAADRTELAGASRSRRRSRSSAAALAISARFPNRTTRSPLSPRTNANMSCDPTAYSMRVAPSLLRV